MLAARGSAAYSVTFGAGSHTIYPTPLIPTVSTLRQLYWVPGLVGYEGRLPENGSAYCSPAFRCGVVRPSECNHEPNVRVDPIRRTVVYWPNLLCVKVAHVNERNDHARRSFSAWPSRPCHRADDPQVKSWIAMAADTWFAAMAARHSTCCPAIRVGEAIFGQTRAYSRSCPRAVLTQDCTVGAIFTS
jgi:hypothetical protein